MRAVLLFRTAIELRRANNSTDGSTAFGAKPRSSGAVVQNKLLQKTEKIEFLWDNRRSPIDPIGESPSPFELEMQELINDLVAKVITLAPEKRYILGVTGYPGAGKSTISESLIGGVNKAAGKEVAMIVPMDGFHLPNEVLINRGLLHLKGIPDSFDADGFVTLLAELRKPAVKPVGCPRFDRSIEASIENGIQISPYHQLLIVEGNYLLYDKAPWDQARQYLDEAWFLDVSLETIYPRLVERHIVGGKTEEEAKAKVASTDLPNARLIEATKIRAHRLVQCELAPLTASEKS